MLSLIRVSARISFSDAFYSVLHRRLKTFSEAFTDDNTQCAGVFRASFDVSPTNKKEFFGNISDTEMGGLVKQLVQLAPNLQNFSTRCVTVFMEFKMHLL